MQKINIHIITLTGDICKLIKRSLDTEKYNINCISTNKIDENFKLEQHELIDCLVLDKGIDSDKINLIKQIYINVPVICLPSLMSEGEINNGATHISEPFKLSELQKVLKELTENA
jgi:DNA-binding response OmpR family regulator